DGDPRGLRRRDGDVHGTCQRRLVLGPEQPQNPARNRRTDAGSGVGMEDGVKDMMDELATITRETGTGKAPVGEGTTVGLRPAAAPPPGNYHDLIRVHGARENNLKDVNVEIPKRRLTVFTGVSGSGKSSLVFDTIAAESQRLINETYSAFVQGFMPTL